MIDGEPAPRLFDAASCQERFRNERAAQVAIAALEADMARREVLVHPGRTPVVLGVDTDVVEAFRAGGPDWRARMTAALRAWVDAHPAE